MCKIDSSQPVHLFKATSLSIVCNIYQVALQANNCFALEVASSVFIDAGCSFCMQAVVRKLVSSMISWRLRSFLQ